ncbi:hypothetical protein JCM16408A_18240 [Methylobacterium phyllosphaerae]
MAVAGKARVEQALARRDVVDMLRADLDHGCALPGPASGRSGGFRRTAEGDPSMRQREIAPGSDRLPGGSAAGQMTIC